MGKHKVMLKVLAHEHALTEISCPGLMNITKALIDRGLILADKHITSDTLCGMDVLRGVGHLSHFISGKQIFGGSCTCIFKGDNAIWPTAKMVSLDKTFSWGSCYMQLICTSYL